MKFKKGDIVIITKDALYEYTSPGTIWQVYSTSHLLDSTIRLQGIKGQQYHNLNEYFIAPKRGYFNIDISDVALFKPTRVEKALYNLV